MILMWRHPKYYQELAKKRKQLEREQANERASEQATLNMIPIVDCEGRCFAVVYEQTGDRSRLV